VDAHVPIPTERKAPAAYDRPVVEQDLHKTEADEQMLRLVGTEISGVRTPRENLNLA
jgi:hypothetical protein